MRLVLLAVTICLFGCYTAIRLLVRARGSEGTVDWRWIAAASVDAGAAVWATHFVAMPAAPASRLKSAQRAQGGSNAWISW